jgi:hypothetical protein
MDPVELTEIVAGTVVAPTQVATPAVAATLLIGALIGSDDTHVNSEGAITSAGIPQVDADPGPSAKPTPNDTWFPGAAAEWFAVALAGRITCTSVQLFSVDGVAHPVNIPPVRVPATPNTNKPVTALRRHSLRAID